MANKRKTLKMQRPIKVTILSLLSLLSLTQVSLADPINKTEILDSLSKYSRENLIKLAIAGDDFQRAKLPSEILILRGLRQFIDTLSNNEIKNIIVSQIENDSNLNLNKLREIAGENASIAFTDYSDYLETLDNDKLKSFALAGEKYWRAKNDKENLRGGLNDYINRLTKSEIINKIQDYTKEFKELSKNGLLEEIAGLGDMITFRPLDEITKSLEKKDQVTLAQIAISIENYEREKLETIIIGGLHDYAYSLSKEELIKVIIKMAHDNPELRIEGKIDALFNSSKAEERKKKGKGPMFGGIEDTIRHFSRAELAYLAIAAEKYDRDYRNDTKIGGYFLSEYVFRLSKEENMKIIMDFVNVYPELRTIGKLESLTEGKVQKGGYHSKLIGKSRQELENICFAVEFKIKLAKGEDRSKGLKDYVGRLSEKQLVEFLDEKCDDLHLIFKEGGIEVILSENRTITEMLF